MRYVLACILAIAAGFAALQFGVGLMGLTLGFESQAFAVLIGLMTAATYEQVARRGAGERRERVPVRVRGPRR